MSWFGGRFGEGGLGLRALGRRSRRGFRSSLGPRELLRERVEESPGYVEAGYAFALGQAVYDRRTELGLSQRELARRAGMTQPQISNIEGGDSVPTLPLLTGLAKALDAALTIDLDADSANFVFTAHDRRRPDEASPGGRPSAA